MSDEARRAAEHAARWSYGRLVALVAARSRDIAGAEDALGEAFRLALETWPRDGPPANPEAWLLTVARRRMGHARRHMAVRHEAAATLDLLHAETAGRMAGGFPDERLKLLFACAHPAIAVEAHTPLMLQAVLGLSAERIAAAFLVSPTAMSQRLVRAKAKIRDAGIRFGTPELEHLPSRLEAVLTAIYAAYGVAWDGGHGEAMTGLAEEALYLSRLIVGFMPEQPEARGLLALMLYCEARARARRTPEGRFVPLAEQDASRWSRALIFEAENQLTAAARMSSFGRFQTEAAIQSLHVQRVLTGRFSSEALLALYDLLAIHDGSVGALVARAAAHGEVCGPQKGLSLLDGVGAHARSYQPYWAARAHLLEACGSKPDAAAALSVAISLTTDPALKAYLEAKAARLEASR